MIINTGGLRR